MPQGRPTNIRSEKVGNNWETMSTALRRQRSQVQILSGAPLRYTLSTPNAAVLALQQRTRADGNSASEPRRNGSRPGQTAYFRIGAAKDRLGGTNQTGFASRFGRPSRP